MNQSLTDNNRETVRRARCPHPRRSPVNNNNGNNLQGITPGQEDSEDPVEVTRSGAGGRFSGPPVLYPAFQWKGSDMGVFFKSQPVQAAITPALLTALETAPTTIPAMRAVAVEQAAEVGKKVRGEFSWGRLAVAFGIILVVFGMAVFAGRDERLADLYGVTVHATELGLGGVLGLLIGEVASKS